MPSEIDTLTSSVQQVLTDLKALPLNELVGDVRTTVQEVNTLLSSPQTKDTVQALQLTVADLQRLASRVDEQIGPLISQTRGVLASAEAMVGPDSQTRYDLNAMLKELAGAARSIRVFADYLERHPEALLRGKAGFASQ